jgi:MFS family permease
MFSGITKSLVDTLVAALAGRVISVLKTEVENAKEEFQEKLRGLLIGIVVLLVAIGFLCFGVTALLISAIAALSTIWPLWQAALVVGGGAVVVAGILAWIGGFKVNKNKNLKPERAIANIRGLVGK